MFYFLARVIPAVLMFISNIYLMKILSPNDYILYSNGFATATLLSLTCSSMLGQSFLRYFPGNKTDAEFNSTWVFFFLIVLSFLAVLFVILDDYRLLVFLTAMMFLLNVLYSIFQGSEQSKLFLISNIARSLIFISTIVVVFAFNKVQPNGSSALWILSISFLIPIGLFIKWAVRPLGTISLSAFSKPEFKKILNFSIPIAVWILFYTFNNMTFRYILLISDELELLNSFVRVHDVVFNITTVMLSFIVTWSHPKFSNLFNRGLLKKFYQIRGHIIYIQVAIGLLGFVSLLAMNVVWPNVINGIGISSIELQIYSLLSAVLAQIALVFHKSLEMSGHLKRMIVFIFVSVGLNGFLMIVFLKFGLGIHSALSLPLSLCFYIILTKFYETRLV